ncbi:MAG: polymorphic toxin type 15 domain-containing protein, partial [Thermoanaerobaculia bacterium]
GLNRAEYDRQLARQQAAIQRMTIDAWLANREAFIQRREAQRAAGEERPTGRAPEAKRSQEQAREEIRRKLIAQKAKDKIKGGLSEAKAIDEATAEVDAFFEGKVALHDPDQVAGGGATISVPRSAKAAEQILGEGSVNSSIGAQWRSKSRVGAVQAAAEKVAVKKRKKEKMNVSCTTA